MSKQRGLKLFAFVLPALLLIPAYPTLSLWWFKQQEPFFVIPLGSADPVQIRKDPYGSGLFGAHRNGGRTHRGIDLVAPLGTPVLAAKSGKAAIGRKRNGMGRYVEVLHPDGWITRYGHLDEILIRNRQKIRRGQVLGTVGKTGNAGNRLIQPHLHFEVWNDQETAVDPLEVMKGHGAPSVPES